MKEIGFLMKNIIIWWLQVGDKCVHHVFSATSRTLTYYATHSTRTHALRGLPISNSLKTFRYWIPLNVTLEIEYTIHMSHNNIIVLYSINAIQFTSFNNTFTIFVLPTVYYFINIEYYINGLSLLLTVVLHNLYKR